jgi:hypothetical protein
MFQSKKQMDPPQHLGPEERPDLSSEEEGNLVSAVFVCGLI